MNLCIFAGTLTRDPEYTTTQSGSSLVNFSIAITNRVKQKDGTYKDSPYFFDLEAWEQQAEFINRFFKKGNGIVVEASARTDTWEQDGKKRSKVKFRVSRASFPPSDRKNNSEHKKTKKVTNEESTNEAFGEETGFDF